MKKLAKGNGNVITKHGSVSEQSDCHDADNDCDSGIGSYDSEAELSNCSSPVIQDNYYDDHQSRKPSRPLSPEFALAEKSRRSPIKRTYSELQRPEIKPYVCHSCSCGFSEANSLRAHARHAHPRKGIIFCKYSCGFCLQHYSTTESLETHVETHRLPETTTFPDKSCSSNRNSFTNDAKSKMSAKSLAFSIENICANSNSNPSLTQVCQEQSSLIGSSKYEPYLQPFLIPSIPITCHSPKGLTSPRLNGGFFTSHASAFCQCHLDMYHLQIH